eukprot:516075_1
MQPLNRPKSIQQIDLTVQSPVSSVTTNSILTGAYHVLNNVNTGIKPNNNTNNTTNINTNTVPPQSIHYNKNNTTTTTTTIKKQQPKANSNTFTSGIVDFVSFNYDANRLKNNDYHNKFSDRFGTEIQRIISSECMNNNNSKIKCQPFDPYKILSTPPLKLENQLLPNEERISDYSNYNLFGIDNTNNNNNNNKNNNNNNNKNNNNNNN